MGATLGDKFVSKLGKLLGDSLGNSLGIEPGSALEKKKLCSVSETALGRVLEIVFDSELKYHLEDRSDPIKEHHLEENWFRNEEKYLAPHSD